MTWKTITLPKTVYFPTLSSDGTFKNSGLRIDPSQTLEILQGSNRIRVDGAEHQLLIAVASLRLDENNRLILDAPAPPVASLASGGGRAYVGGIGFARGEARGEARAAAGYNVQDDWPVGAPKDLDSDLEEVASFDPKATSPEDPIDNKVFHEERLTRTVTLKDGTTAEVLIDPSSGHIASNPFRTYAGPGLNPKAAMQLQAEQRYSAKIVAGAGAQGQGQPQPAPKQPPPDPQPQPAPLENPQGASTGNIHLDGFLTLFLGSKGFPVGQATLLRSNVDLWTPPAIKAETLEQAFVKIHTTPPGQIVLVDVSNRPVNELAEFLPPLLQAISGAGAAALALVILCSDPILHPLLDYLLPHHINVQQVTDQFLTASLPKAHGRPVATHEVKAVTFPATQ